MLCSIQFNSRSFKATAFIRLQTKMNLLKYFPASSKHIVEGEIVSAGAIGTVAFKVFRVVTIYICRTISGQQVGLLKVFHLLKVLLVNISDHEKS